MDNQIYRGRSFCQGYTVSGIYNLKDRIRMLEDVVAACRFWKPGMNLLIDDRNLDFQSTSLEELSEAGRRRSELDALIGGGRTAVLVGSLTEFVRVRQYELIASGKVSTKMDIFKDEADARPVAARLIFAKIAASVYFHQCGYFLIF